MQSSGQVIFDLELNFCPTTLRGGYHAVLERRSRRIGLTLFLGFCQQQNYFLCQKRPTLSANRIYLSTTLNFMRLVQAINLIGICLVVACFGTVESTSGGLRHSSDSLSNVLPENVPTEEELDPSLVHPLYKTFANLTDDEIDAILLERDSKPSYHSVTDADSTHRGLMPGHHNKIFKESHCNDEVKSAACIPFDDFMANQDPTSAEVKIPCGICVALDKRDGSTHIFPHGFNIVGKLHIPNDARVTIRSKYVLVQGTFRVDPPQMGYTLPHADGSKVVFQLMGNEAVTFHPDADTDNVMACGMEDDMVTPKACNVGIKPFAIAGGRLDINAIDDACPSWTKLKTLSTDKTTITLVDPAAASCYGPGAELLFTSEDVADAGLGYQLATVFSADPSTGTIVLTEPLARKVTSVEESTAQGYGDLFAVEVAIMDRYISFEPYDQEGLIGGHTIILHSPEIIQNIRGVEFRKFGQQGNLGRYPLHFHLSENVDGSFAYKNLVRDSNQRCYVTHGTHNVTWQENVAFDTFGHCYLLEDGGEWDNKFLYNLAAVTKQPETIIRPEESDRVTTTSFWMTTMTNHFIGNVAAGSANIGFWFETMLREPSRSLSANEGITSTSRLPLGTFDDNVAHSCYGSGMALYPSGYKPDTRAEMNGLKFYKNGARGAFFAQSRNITTNDSIFADNRGGMLMKGTTKYELHNVTIIGVSENQKAILAENRRTYRQWQTDQCQRQKDIDGVGFRFNSGLGLGSTFNGINFQGFSGNDACESSNAITAEKTNIRHGLQDSLHLFKDISFDSYSNRLSFCLALEPGLAENGGDARNLAVNDLQGTINLAGIPGFFLQEDDPVEDAFLNGNCAPEGGCAKFCPGACLRLVVLRTSGSFIHEDTLMKVTDKSTGKFVLRPRNIIAKISQMPTTDAYYGVWLPGGTQYDVTFVKPNGAPTWPGYAYMDMDAEPNCASSLQTTDVTLDYPAPSSRCLNAIFNGDIETGLIDGWQERTNYKPFGEVISPGADGTSFALKTTARALSGGSTLVNRVDVSCLKGWAGEEIRLRGKIRLLNAEGQDVACSIAEELPSSCPLIQLKLGSEILLSQFVETSADGSWGSISEVRALPPNETALADVAEIVIDKAYHTEFLIDEFHIDYLGDQTYGPTSTPTSLPTMPPRPTSTPTVATPQPTSASPTPQPTESPLDGVCSKYTTTGWHGGNTIANLLPSESISGETWAWQECAKKCAEYEDCTFWTIRLTGDKGCLIKNNQGTYYDHGDHIEGPRDLDCLSVVITASPTPFTTPSPTTDKVCKKNDTTGWTSGHTIMSLWSELAPNGSEWSWEQCAEQCALNSDCEFWTLRLTGNKACLLKKNAGAYQGGSNHYEGWKDTDCIVTDAPTQSPTTLPPTSAPTDEPEPIVVSPKKGIGMHTAQSCNALDNYDGASWYYDWGKGDGFERGFCSDPTSVTTSLEFVPMLWDHWSIPSTPLSGDFLNTYGANFENAQYIMTFNEPERHDQANMSPLYAAERWADIVNIASLYNLKIVAPCGTIDHGFTWYNEWIGHCNDLYGPDGCAFDYTCLHAYYQPEPCTGIPGWACVSDVMNKINNWKNTFGKPTWVTEFACNPWEGSCDASKQAELMQQIVPMFEASDAVFRYAWFEAFASNFGDANTNEMIFDFSTKVTCENKKWLAQRGSASWQVSTIGQCLAKADAPDSGCFQPATLSFDDDNCYCATDPCDSYVPSYDGMQSWKEVRSRETNELTDLGKLYQSV